VAPQDQSGQKPPWLLGIVVIAVLIWLMPSEQPMTAPSSQVSTAETAAAPIGKAHVLAAARLQSPVPFNETVSRWLCEDAIRRRVSHSSTIDFRSIVDYAPDAMSDGARVIWQTFSAKNDDGLERTYRARCEVSPDGHLDSIVINEK
jgi:hypothetical protein